MFTHEKHLPVISISTNWLHLKMGSGTKDRNLCGIAYGMNFASQVSSIKTFYFSTLYTTLPHDKLQTRLKETIHKAFSHRNYGSKFVVLGYNSTYFSNKIRKGKPCYSEEQVISMLEFLIDNIFVSFGGALFQQAIVSMTESFMNCFF
jgi:hypothetical protein